MSTALLINEPFAFKMSKSVQPAKAKELWVGSGPAMATEFYCTSGAAAYYINCNAFYTGGGMSCSQSGYLSNGYGLQCDAY